ncbi:MAG: thioredoxin family protein [Phycisphaerales bacterium]|nr:thioredoxin family protein [Phycisphaerales bacterium]
MMTPSLLKASFDVGLPYGRYVETGTPAQQANWNRFRDQVPDLSDQQRKLVASFSRRMPVLVISGTWCGDCVQQCPMLERIAEANREAIDLRFVDRDEHKDLADRVMICGGHRVPTVIFMNEEFEFVSLLGDRTLARYRAIAARQLGASCPYPGAPVPADEIAATMQDWLNEFERAALLLRLSPKLRQKHGD